MKEEKISRQIQITQPVFDTIEDTVFTTTDGRKFSTQAVDEYPHDPIKKIAIAKERALAHETQWLKEEELKKLINFKLIPEINFCENSDAYHQGSYLFTIPQEGLTPDQQNVLNNIIDGMHSVATFEQTRTPGTYILIVYYTDNYNNNGADWTDYSGYFDTLDNYKHMIENYLLKIKAL